MPVLEPDRSTRRRRLLNTTVKGICTYRASAGSRPLARALRNKTVVKRKKLAENKGL